MLYIHILVNNGLAKIYLFEIAPKTVEIKYYLNKITELMENFNYKKNGTILVYREKVITIH